MVWKKIESNKNILNDDNQMNNKKIKRWVNE